MPVGIELVTLYPENEIAREANNGFPVELGGVRGDRDLYYFAGDGDSCRIADRFIIDFLDRRYDADHAVYGSGVESDITGCLYYSDGDAGG